MKIKTARPVAQLKQGRNDWYRITNRADGPAEVWIYDEIGYFGVTAQDFVRDLREVKADEILVHLNTPGGDVFDGVAIYNALRDHPAQVTVTVDALAASAGSFIAQAGDLIRMNRASQMMIHDASGLCVGNATDMREMVDLLDRVSGTIAEIYAGRAGGTVADWRERMRAETWFTAAEAVEAGLADEVAEPPEREESDALTVAASWDLSIFRHPGREQAPAPEPVTAAAEPVRLNAPLKPDAPAPEPVLIPDFTIDPAAFRAAAQAAIEPLPLSWDADLFRAAVTNAANDVCAPPEPTPPPVPDTEPVFAIDRSAFVQAIREARL